MPIINLEISTKTNKTQESYYSRTHKNNILYDFTSTTIDFNTIKYEMISCEWNCMCRESSDETNQGDEIKKIQFELDNIHNDTCDDEESKGNCIDKIKEILNDNMIYKICQIVNSNKDNNNKINDLVREFKSGSDLTEYPYNKSFEYDISEKTFRCSIHIPSHITINQIFLTYKKDTDEIGSCSCCQGTYCNYILQELSMIEPDQYNKMYKCHDGYFEIRVETNGKIDPKYVTDHNY
jgi:hypothetical protein